MRHKHPLFGRDWLGHQIYSSAVYVNDLQGPKLYLGDDVFSITAVNATDGSTLSTYTTGGPVFTTACVYNGTLYMGTEEGYMYAFRDPTPTNQFLLSAEANKGEVMWNNETLIIQGKLLPTPKTYNDPQGNPTTIGSYEINRLPNATVSVSIVLPDNTSETLNATTNNEGFYTVAYNPSQVGNYSWIAVYNGEKKAWITYEPAFTTYRTINVVAANSQPQTTSTPSETPSTSPTASPTATSPEVTTTPQPNTNNMQYVYVAIAVIVIIVVVIAAYMFLARKKKPT